jgi:putative addiction module killer protein
LVVAGKKTEIRCLDASELGYRVYFGQDKNIVVILLSGGTKKRQQKEIDKAKLFWKDYKQRKR